MNSNKAKNMKILVLLASGIFLALVMLGSSCRKGLPTFSHKNHVQDQALQCDTCHTGSKDGAQAGVPSPDVCATCHEEAKDKKNLELAKSLAQKWPRFKTLSPDGIFSHKKHKDAGINCESCHYGIAKSKKVSQNFMPDEKTCLKCHKEKRVSTNCATCHQKISPTSAPPDHAQSWAKFHGEAARDPVRGGRCARCHTRNTCDTCHQTQRPADHTGASWVEFGHGADSRLDRSRCATCHRSDFCMTCHKESEPRSHAGAWGPPSDRHCFDCHLPGGGMSQDCAVCHGARISHPDAPARPSGLPHSAATDCQSCHTGFLMRHPDNGDNCLNCHK